MEVEARYNTFRRYGPDVIRFIRLEPIGPAGGAQFALMRTEFYGAHRSFATGRIRLGKRSIL